MRRALALVTLALLLVPAAAAAKPRRLHVAMTAQSHHPKLGHTWWYRVTVTDATTHRRVAAHVHLQFYFGSAPVGEVGRHFVRKGIWTETIPAKGKNAFPPAAVGPKLVLHAAVTAKGYRPASAGWKLTVVR